MKLKKCDACDIYTLEEVCLKCGQPTTDAHYKFIKTPSENTDENKE